MGGLREGYSPLVAGACSVLPSVAGRTRMASSQSLWTRKRSVDSYQQLWHHPSCAGLRIAAESSLPDLCTSL